MKKIFKDFLKSHDAYNEYIIQLTCNEYRPKTFDKFVDNINHNELVTMAFVWDYSPGGYEFWKDIALLWTKRLEELI